MDAIYRVRLFLAYLLAQEGVTTFDSVTMQGLEVVDAKKGWVKCKLTVENKLQNRHGTLHGGCIATLIDVVGSLAIVTESDRGGVSLIIENHYHRPMPGGQVMEIEAEVIKRGRNIATTQVTLRPAAKHQLEQEQLEQSHEQPQSQNQPPQQQQQQQQVILNDKDLNKKHQQPLHHHHHHQQQQQQPLAASGIHVKVLVPHSDVAPLFTLPDESAARLAAAAAAEQDQQGGDKAAGKRQHLLLREWWDRGWVPGPVQEMQQQMGLGNQQGQHGQQLDQHSQRAQGHEGTGQLGAAWSVGAETAALRCEQAQLEEPPVQTQALLVGPLERQQQQEREKQGEQQQQEREKQGEQQQGNYYHQQQQQPQPHGKSLTAPQSGPPPLAPSSSPSSSSGSAAAAAAEALRRADLFLHSVIGVGSGWDALTLQGASLLAAAPGAVCVLLPVTSRVTNTYGTLHGGCIATLVDVIGTAGLVTSSPKGGVSLALSVHYHRPAAAGQVVMVLAKVVKIGRQIATIEVLVYDPLMSPPGESLPPGPSSMAAETAASQVSPVRWRLVAEGTHVKALVSGSDLSWLWRLQKEEVAAAVAARRLQRPPLPPSPQQTLTMQAGARRSGLAPKGRSCSDQDGTEGVKYQLGREHDSGGINSRL